MVTARRARFTGLIVLLLTFLAGGLVGAATLQMLNAEETPPERRAQNSGGQDYLQRLSLTPEQRTQIETILERRRVQMGNFWSEHGPQLRAITDSARAELRSVLTPEQRVIEEQYRAERRQHQEKRERGDFKW